MLSFVAAAAHGQAEMSYVAGELIVRIRAGLGSRSFTGVLARHGLRERRTVAALRIALVTVTPGRALADVVADLVTDPDVEFAHPNYLGQGGFVPFDTYFADQWHHRNDGVPGADIDSTAAWDITRGDPAIVLAVLDTGIQSDHPDFLGRILPGYDFVNDDADPEADHSHGVECAGLAAANADNGFAVAGVDHFVSILPVKVLDEFNAGTTMALIEGLDFAGARADVLSLSLINYPDTAGLNTALQAARDAGAILIACAGNGGIGNADVTMPGKSPLTISVGATTVTDRRASFSGTGAALDVVAPGAAVITARYGTTADESQSFSGCSAATPVGRRSSMVPETWSATRPRTHPDATTSWAGGGSTPFERYVWSSAIRSARSETA